MRRFSAGELEVNILLMPIYMRGSELCPIIDLSITGGHILVMDRLVAQIQDFVEASRTKAFYYGKASGSDYHTALYRRDDRYKQENGINLLAAMYRSSSRESVGIVEGALSEYLFDHPKCINRIDWSSGRKASGPTYFIYLALRLWPAPREGEFER